MNQRGSTFFAELKRRNVLRAGAFYAASAWLLVQVATQVFPFFHIAEWVVRWIVVAACVGFPFAMLFSWFYEWTPQGLMLESEIAPSESATRQSGKKLDRWIIAILALAVVLLLTNQFVLHRDEKPAEDTPVAPAIPEKSIAVLPFENLSDDKSNAYFADGIQDEILTRLAKIGALRVISRTSTQQYASKPGNLTEIARQLGVANILEGSVQKAGDTVRINVQLIKARGDMHLWAEVYDRKLNNIFGVESEVATAIANALNARLTGAEQKDLAVRPTSNPAAYDAYLRGLAFALRADALDVNIAKSIAAFEEVVRLDPGFAAAWAWLSQQHAYAYLRGDHSPSQKEAARAALETAVRLAPDASETLTAQGFYRYRIERDYDGAREIFQRLRERSPNDHQATWALAAIARRQGRWDESLNLYEQAMVIGPRDGQTLNNAADTALAMRDWPAAQRLVDHALDISPDAPGALRRQVYLLQEKGEVDRAQKILNHMPIAPGDVDTVFAFTTNTAMMRAYAPAIALLKSQLEKPETLGFNLGIFQETLGDFQRLAGDSQAAKSSYEQARETLKAALRAQPNSPEPELVAFLAAAEAGLGNQAEALAMARRAIELLPASKDAYIGPLYEEYLARLQARFGDKDSAIPALRHLLSISYGYPPITVATLRLDPDFDNLRGDPRFQKLITDGEKAMKAQTTP